MNNPMNMVDPDGMDPLDTDDYGKRKNLSDVLTKKCPDCKGDIILAEVEIVAKKLVKAESNGKKDYSRSPGQPAIFA
jgi:hypothetical protein